MSEPTPALFEVKMCRECGAVKPVDAFEPRRGKCRECRYAYLNQQYQRNREKRLAQAAEHAKRNPPDPAKRRLAERRRSSARRLTGGECLVEACGRHIHSVKYRLCSLHYRHLLRTGSSDRPIRLRKKVARGATCSAEQCFESHHAHGLCRQHYRAWRHQQDPEEGRAAARRRRARKLELPAERYTLADIIDRDGTACVLCGGELDLDAVFPDRKSPSVEHLECLSWSDSAGDVLSNVAASHLGCNNGRVNRPHPAAARKRAELLGRKTTDREATA